MLTIRNVTLLILPIRPLDITNRPATNPVLILRLKGFLRKLQCTLSSNAISIWVQRVVHNSVYENNILLTVESKVEIGRYV